MTSKEMNGVIGQEPTWKGPTFEEHWPENQNSIVTSSVLSASLLAARVLGAGFPAESNN